jgi:TBCC domain-containing protein 1
LIALVQLADSTCVHDIEYTGRQDRKASSKILDKYTTFDPDVLLRRHEDEHGDVGFNVHMTVEDLERLNLILQAPFGGKINDPALYISDFMPPEDLAVYGGISLELVEQELRRHLENDLLESNDSNSQDDKTSDVLPDVGNLSLEEKTDDADSDRNKYKELSYTKIRGSTVYLHPIKPVQRDTLPDGSLVNGGRLHDVHISGCSDAHLYLLQPFEHATITACYGCTIVVGAVAGLLDVVDCERCTVTGAARRVLVSNCYDVTMSIFTPSPPLLCGDNRNCQFAPYNTYYDGLRDDLLSTGLAAVLVSTDNTITPDPLYGPALQCASNKWKIPLELSKLSDLLHASQSVPRSSSPVLGASADEKQMSTDDTVKISTLVPASDFNVVIIPFASKIAKERHQKQQAKADDVDVPGNESSGSKLIKGRGMGAQYCYDLADVIQLCPFRLPTEYERMVLAKADRIKNLQYAIETELTPEQQVKLAEELNQSFRDWLVTSGNLRQVLDLVHLDNKSNS